MQQRFYSDAFQGLPEIARHPVYRRLWEVLGGADRSPAFAHLSDADRGAILEILEETESRFAAWRAECPTVSFVESFLSTNPRYGASFHNCDSADGLAKNRQMFMAGLLARCVCQQVIGL